MAIIKILPHPEYCPQGAQLDVPAGTSICEALLEHKINIEHACDMSCACTTCHVIVRQGEQYLSEMEDDEADRLDTAWDLTTSSRLGCQAVIQGDVTVEFPMYTRNYVQEGGGIQLGKSDPQPEASSREPGAGNLVPEKAEARP